jgi:hypothetical protein
MHTYNRGSKGGSHGAADANHNTKYHLSAEQAMQQHSAHGQANEGMKDELLSSLTCIGSWCSICCGNKIQHNDASFITVSAVWHTALLVCACFLI